MLIFLCVTTKNERKLINNDNEETKIGISIFGGLAPEL